MKYILIFTTVLLLFACTKPIFRTCWDCQVVCGRIKDTVVCNNGVPPGSFNDNYGNVCGLINCVKQ